jgi:hypothetical protein
MVKIRPGGGSKDVTDKKKSRNAKERDETDLELNIFKRLKVPKCEIFDRSDYHDFYTIKPFCVVGDFAVII